MTKVIDQGERVMVARGNGETVDDDARFLIEAWAFGLRRPFANPLHSSSERDMGKLRR